MVEGRDYSDKQAFIASTGANFGFAAVGDFMVYERHTIGEEPGKPKFLHTANFRLRSDAAMYCRAKYGDNFGGEF